MACFLFYLFARFELATRGSKCAAFGRNSPGDCFAASALYFCARLRISAGGAAGMSCFLFYLFARFELATRGSKCAAFGRNSPGDCFAASALYFCARLRISAGGAAGMSCFLFYLFARFELATRGSKCAAFGRNSPGDCFAASALYFCARLRISAGGAAGMSCFLFYLFARFELATRGSKCAAFGRNSPGDCFAASALYLCADYSFLPVEQPECPASFFLFIYKI